MQLMTENMIGAVSVVLVVWLLVKLTEVGRYEEQK